jgi:catechol 2,3-dioxygenase-like lactoylglutathione lyase family enzyme
MMHHVALGAQDVERVAAFYTRYMGLVEVARHTDAAGALRSIWLKLSSSAVLMIERTTQPQRAVEGIGAGPFLLAFGAVDQDEHEARCAQLVADGYVIEARTGYTSYTRDPEGNRVAISCYPLPLEAP